MSLYDKYILPSFLNCACGSKPINYQRQKVVPQASGVILEVGIGSGLNIPFYDRSKVEEVIGLDPSPELNAMAKKVADEYNLPVDFMLSGAEEMALPNNYVDTVLVTYTMCTIPDVLSANKEMLRVLKPGGKLIFCEHGLAPDANVSKWQSRIDPFWGKIAGGCHLNRNIPELIRSAGFQIQTMDEMYLPSTPKFAGYNYWGTAVL
ncbi:MAG: class I SAM-dependent methyltransferase [Porticoccaceae bacterium]|jgi:ubiquinone/menaquinone biosynthesis C-methylase UbiE|nr:class I SAM-dependent methyltransferase [Porticoccaceae bacterium]MBT3799161.1 class I SAM-dependent methyltransferase [Porticoccaceae bacterium]MBT4163760.1 class I SAM-dependent methyltransferase [Porticoccaceae bacterium]MBT4211978.1 class I SAM-dependent methyltransferase [Porticoccaceae bacterium]MBT4592601.1 class I SAM-dependent methyltransferase [Porticoccaceae bacterium]